MFEILGPLGLEWCFTKITDSAKLIYEFRKGAKKRREGITRREFPSPRPIKKSSTKRSKHLITEIYIYIYIYFSTFSQ